MLADAQVAAFIATADAARARAFYEGTLGLRCVADEPYALVFDLNGVILRIQKVREMSVAPYTALGWRVGDIATQVRALLGRGVTFERYGEMGQDELGIWNSGSSLVAWFKDPDGNTLSLSQEGGAG